MGELHCSAERSTASRKKGLVISGAEQVLRPNSHNRHPAAAPSLTVLLAARRHHACAVSLSITPWKAYFAW